MVISWRTIMGALAGKSTGGTAERLCPFSAQAVAARQLARAAIILAEAAFHDIVLTQIEWTFRALWPA
jgi:hypothetical protein